VCDGFSGCVDGPRRGCKLPVTARTALLLLKDATPDTGDQVVFKWNKGAATTVAELGDPATSDDYALCVYDGTAALLMRTVAPAGGTCGTHPCWKPKGTTGLGYKDALGDPDGVDKITLKAGAATKAKVQVKAKGVNAPLPALGNLSLPLRAQVQGEQGGCWEASFGSTGVVRNDADQFMGKAD
jgi:hypothetical protein